MGHTDREIDEAAQRFADRARELDDSAEAEIIDDLRMVAEAADAVAASEARLRETVRRARAHGRSWNRIAVALGTSRQAARQRFASMMDA